MLHLRGLDSVRIGELTGHADEGMVRDGGVREQDRVGDNAADEAADFGRRRVGLPVIDARRNFSGVCGRWYLVILTLHHFFLLSLGLLLIMLVETSFGLVSWCSSEKTQIGACCAGSCFSAWASSIWEGEWVTLASAPITAAEVGAWPYSVGILVTGVSFLGSLYWPAAGADLGVGGVSLLRFSFFSALGW